MAETTTTTFDILTSIDPHPIWEPMGEAFYVACCLTMGITAAWFVLVNYIAPEAHHPLDFYSNQLRTKPYVFIGLIVFIASGTIASKQSSQIAMFLRLLPNLALVMYSYGLLIVVAVLFKVSAGAAIVAAAFSIVTSVATLLIVMIPEISGMPWIYSTGYLVVNYVIVYWVRAGVMRHVKYDGGKPLLPEGADAMFSTYSAVTLKGAPPLLVTSVFAFHFMRQLETGNLGWAFFLAYIVLACCLLLGCSSDYRAGTEIE